MNKDLIALYDAFYEELLAEVESLDGIIDDFSPEDSLIAITVLPEYEEYIAFFLIELINKYELKKKKLLGLHVFDGVRQFLD